MDDKLEINENGYSLEPKIEEEENQSFVDLYKLILDKIIKGTLFIPGGDSAKRQRSRQDLEYLENVMTSNMNDLNFSQFISPESKHYFQQLRSKIDCEENLELKAHWKGRLFITIWNGYLCLDGEAIEKLLILNS